MVMIGVNASTDRRVALRWLAHAAVALAALAGLFAMHGLTMVMPAAIPMSNSSIGSGPANATSTSIQIPTGDAVSAIRMGAVSEASDAAASASITATPMAGAHNGCDAEHDGCLATLRAQPHPLGPAPITLTSAVADPLSLFSHLSLAELLRRGPPPPRPCLTELCISRT